MGQRYVGEWVFPGAGPSLGAQLELALFNLLTAPCCEYPLVCFQNPLEGLQPISRCYKWDYNQLTLSRGYMRIAEHPYKWLMAQVQLDTPLRHYHGYRGAFRKVAAAAANFV